MSGVGRKSGYRKGVVDSVEDSYSQLDDGNIKPNQILGQVSEQLGKTFNVILPKGKKVIVRMPSKFHKLIFIKRGDILLLEKLPNYSQTNENEETNEEELIEENITDESLDIKCVLNKNHIKAFDKKNLLPSTFNLGSKSKLNKSFILTFFSIYLCFIIFFLFSNLYFIIIFSCCQSLL